MHSRIMQYMLCVKAPLARAGTGTAIAILGLNSPHSTADSQIDPALALTLALVYIVASATCLLRQTCQLGSIWIAIHPWLHYLAGNVRNICLPC